MYVAQCSNGGKLLLGSLPMAQPGQMESVRDLNIREIPHMFAGMMDHILSRVAKVTMYNVISQYVSHGKSFQRQGF